MKIINLYVKIAADKCMTWKWKFVCDISNIGYREKIFP